MADTNPEAQAQGAAETLEAGEFASLLQKNFKPKSDRQKEAIEEGVRTLAEQALADSAVVSDDAVKSIEAIIAELDRKLTEQVNQIIHQDDFQALEGTWRGLHHLVSNTETDETLKIRVCNISKKEVGKTLKKFKGAAWDQSPLFK
ncbi:MAG: type VI secretion system contractile sheath large subunit, partial [Phycisphaerales bacterium]|nr:type VI secretion system contractile sheath large subunit [Phycisphaerales bacterium]